jgi:hypothetical protein
LQPDLNPFPHQIFTSHRYTSFLGRKIIVANWLLSFGHPHRFKGRNTVVGRGHNGDERGGQSALLLSLSGGFVCFTRY